MPAEDLLSDLTEAQRQAVLTTDGPLLVLAGPGSGKTRVITRRAAHIASTVARPDQVLAITFTNKAAGEMRERIVSLGVSRGSYGPMWVCTFHSLCARLLRDHAYAVGLKPNFTIFDEADQRGLIKEAVSACGLSTDNWSPRNIQAVISTAKNKLVGPDEFTETAGDYSTKTIARIYSAYQKRLVEQNAADFDDLLMHTALMLERDEEIRAQLGDRFRYLLIDEYQDTNHAQYMIARLLASAHQNLCATGDPDQSIYAWRGANIQNILDFERDYPQAQVVRLEENFRSTGLILSGASQLISHNHRRKKKDLWSSLEPGEPIRHWVCEDERHEAAMIAQDIRKHLDEGGRGGDAAIFYRINALTRVLEDELRGRRVPYKIVRGVEFYNRKEIRDVIAYLRVIANPSDEAALLRIINVPARGIGKTTVARLQDEAGRSGRTIFDIVSSPPEDSTGSALSWRKLTPFAELVRGMCELPARPVATIVSSVLERTRLERALAEQVEIDADPLANVRELVTAARQYDMENPDGSLGEWLTQISLMSDADAIDDSGGPVLLMTLHTAKGLEFSMVYIVGLEEGLLPHSRAMMGTEADEMEEERRLLFVGMTRAMNLLTLTQAKYRMVRGITERSIASRFLGELPKVEISREVFEVEQDRSRAHLGRYNDDDDSCGDPYDYHPGQRVRHPEYGDGQVVRMEPRGKTLYICIRFDEHGERSFAADHVPLYVMD